MDAHDLPSPRRTDAPYRIAVVCLGNICRSPMADVVLQARLADAGLADEVEVDSFGTGGWHVGRTMDDRAAATLASAGLDPTRHRARQVDGGLGAAYDLVLAMDRANHDDLDGLGVPAERLRLFRHFDPDPDDGEVPDPYYGGDDGFAAVLAMVERTADVLVEALRHRVASRA
jgi:protein-tyrosine phosphatase